MYSRKKQLLGRFVKNRTHRNISCKSKKTIFLKSTNSNFVRLVVNLEKCYKHKKDDDLYW